MNVRIENIKKMRDAKNCTEKLKANLDARVEILEVDESNMRAVILKEVRVGNVLEVEHVRFSFNYRGLNLRTLGHSVIRYNHPKHLKYLKKLNLNPWPEYALKGLNN